MTPYNHKAIEKRWQAIWAAGGIYTTKDNGDKPKCYILDMFPYPSGEGLHVGHPRGYIATDVYSRMKTLQGYNVLHPMGWDAFGLPAEQFAIKNKVHPRISVQKNVARYKEQLSIMGFNYDWSREIDTTDPAFYHWTQWIFLKMFGKGLAYESHEPINWCPTCQTGLANEDLEGGNCERCDTPVEKKPMRQWVLRITEYADRLLADLDKLDWPTSIKESQKNWIGRSEGAEIDFTIKDREEKITVFTTRPDTLFGATFIAISAELAKKWFDDSLIQGQDIENYIQTTIAENAKRTFEEKEKTGIFSGLYVINPANNEEIPVWIANYIIGDVGTGAIMAVPAHDERDFDFAQKFGLQKKCVIKPSSSSPYIRVLVPASTMNEHDVKAGEIVEEIIAGKRYYSGDGELIASGSFTGVYNEIAKKDITNFVGGRWATKYKLKDWVFSRQRYWGEPIPLIHCEQCGVVPVPEKYLPVKLPDVESYEPTGTGESPLAGIAEWVNTTCPKCGGAGKRETNTMPQWAGSSWYYLRYIDPENNQALVDKDKEKYWSPVDLYVGGAEHATRHLIYARFYHKFLYDMGVVNYDEPFKRLQNVGLIMANDGRKMSKRWGNVINPDDIVREHGADTLRLYEMFMGPFGQSVSWSTESILGPRRFLERVWKLQYTIGEETALETSVQKAIKKVEEDIETFSFNTAISTLMILVNEMEKNKVVSREHYEILLKLLSPFAPHVTEELWHMLGNAKSIHLAVWPKYDEDKITEEEITIAIQVDGKVRDTIVIPADMDEDLIQGMAMSTPPVKKWVQGKIIKKVIYVKGKLVSIVTNMT